jgi:general secretion pathway protein G
MASARSIRPLVENVIKTAFTLVEILIVVLILAILAVIVLPQFSNATTIARASMVADDLRVFRTQMAVYKAQHNGKSLGYPSAGNPSEAILLSQATLASNVAGDTAAIGTAGFNYGPYLREVPPNPLNGKTSIQVVADGAAFPAAGTDNNGWVYQPSTDTLRADSPGQDDTGKRYFDY